jgi:PAS domain S-box-containing protein
MGKVVETSGELKDLTIEELRARLAEAEETIRAISAGEVDAVVVNGAAGPRIYTLEGADHPYRVMVEQMHEGTVTLDRERVILYSNPQFTTMVDSASEPVSGWHFDRFLPPADLDAFSALIDMAFLRGHSSSELDLVTKNGETVPVLASLTALDVAEMQNICLVLSDLREQRRNEAVVKEEQLSRLILEQAGEGVVVIDPEGVIVRRSESAKRLSARQHVGRFDDAFPLVAFDSPFRAQRILDDATSGERIRGLEAAMQHPDGRQFSLLVSASPLWSANRTLLGCVITLTDITQRKRAEEAQARQAGELAQSNGDLRQFAYSASHDLREPLRQIAVFSELLQKNYQSKLDTEAGPLIHNIVEGAHQMERLLSGLLAYTQAAGAPQQEAAPTDANEAVQKTLAVLKSQIGDNGAQVSCGQLPVLEVHEVHLLQLFQNLIGNALKYRSQAPPRIHISAEQVHDMWQIAVSDNGIGIETEYQGQVFGLFKRLHGGGKYSGSGIGLAICQKIVQRYGGRIWVESEPGSGSRFLFTLPGEGSQAATTRTTVAGAN